MLRPCYAYANQDAAVGARPGEAFAPVQHSSPGDHISCASPVGLTRSATGNATGNETVAYRNKQVARRGRTTACSRTGSALPSASVDQIMKSRDQWRREAERVRALIAQVTPWSLLWWRCLDTFRAW